MGHVPVVESQIAALDARLTAVEEHLHRVRPVEPGEFFPILYNAARARLKRLVGKGGD